MILRSKQSNLFSCEVFFSLQRRNSTCPEEYHEKNNSLKSRTPGRINFDATAVVVAGSEDGGNAKVAIATRSCV